MRRTISLLAFLVLASGAAWPRGDAYMLRYGQTNVTLFTVNGGPLRELVAAQRRFGNGDYLWVRISGQEYLFRGEAFLREAADLWAPVEAMKPEERALNDEESRLDKRIDAIEDGRATAAPGELRQLRARYQVVERRLNAVDARSEALEKEIEVKLRALIERAISEGAATPLR